MSSGGGSSTVAPYQSAPPMTPPAPGQLNAPGHPADGGYMTAGMPAWMNQYFGGQGPNSMNGAVNVNGMYAAQPALQQQLFGQGQQGITGGPPPVASASNMPLPQSHLPYGSGPQYPGAAPMGMQGMNPAMIAHYQGGMRPMPGMAIARGQAPGIGMQGNMGIGGQSVRPMPGDGMTGPSVMPPGLLALLQGS